MAGRLEGSVALVTGAGAGIGKAYCERFVAEGARIVAADIDGDRAEAVAGELGDAAVAIQADVTQAGDNQRAVAEAVERFGKLDTLVGNAGVFDGFLPLAAFEDAATLEKLFDRLFAVNVKGYLLGAQAAMPELLKSGGSMVFTASTAGFHPNQGGVVYTVSKHAVVGLVRELAFELAPKVRVNAVAPGGTFTDLRNAIPLGQEYGDDRSLFDTPGLDEFITGSTPLRRVNSPEDHAGLAVFLASPEAQGVTGLILNSDGGYGIRGAGSAAGGDEL
jgi:NAD(P)-dependent dehydrogenase (short-subunit alcohol dehydrogenase family)